MWYTFVENKCDVSFCHFMHYFLREPGGNLVCRLETSWCEIPMGMKHTGMKDTKPERVRRERKKRGRETFPNTKKGLSTFHSSA